MERFLFYLRLFPGAEPEYERRHAAIWPELTAAIRESGLRNMTGFRRGTDVWYYLEAHPDAATAMALHGAKRVKSDWNEYFRNVIAEMTDADGELFTYREIFHSNGASSASGGASGGAGDSQGTGGSTFERGCFSLIVEPGREHEYDELHHHAWPELIDAIQAAGIRNYTGFRRGVHVVYYGEFHPEMATAFARLGETEVDKRWSEAFEGIISTITDADGNLLVAREVFHQD